MRFPQTTSFEGRLVKCLGEVVQPLGESIGRVSAVVSGLHNLYSCQILN